MYDKNFYTRYSRHFLLYNVGLEGQKKLLESKVLIVGVGGLGSPVALYLAAAGIGTIGLVEFDTVDISNLQRQVLYDSTSLNKKKCLMAKKKLTELNPTINIKTYDVPLDKSNAEDIISMYDYVVDATDNFYVRYLISDICEKLMKPYVYGSVFEFEGQVSVFCTKEGFTYRDLFVNGSSQVKELGILDKGILGTTPGVIGCIQATEIIKLILNIGENLIGKLLIYDALEMDFQKVNLIKRKKEISNEIEKEIKENLKVEKLRISEIKKLSPFEQKELVILNLDNTKYNSNDLHCQNLNLPVNEVVKYIYKFSEYKEILVLSASENLSLLIAKGLIERKIKAKMIIE